jgi:hypothetical protein
MRFVKIRRTSTGFALDPTPYLDVLEGLGENLPPGALAFARDPDHYDFTSPRCPKDLKLARMSVTDKSEELLIELDLAPLQVGYTRSLVVRYRHVSKVVIDAARTPRSGKIWLETGRLDSVQLDEILPSAEGCSHEIRFIGGTVLIVAADLVAEWHGI